MDSNKAIDLLMQIDHYGLTEKLRAEVHDLVSEEFLKMARYKVGDTIYYLFDLEIRKDKITKVVYNHFNGITYWSESQYAFTEDLIFPSIEELIETYEKKVFGK